MKKTGTSVAKTSRSPRPKKAVSAGRNAKFDWSAVDALTDAEVMAAAKSDPDAQPMTKAQLARMKPVNLARRVRLGLALSQQEFAARYKLPIGSIRDWEQGRSHMDAATIGYYVAIKADPKGVYTARQKEPVQQ